MRINLIEYFLETARKYPARIAVIEEEQKISFAELRRRSVTFSYAMVKKMDSINKPIAVFLPKSINSVIANLAITYSGNIYMNLDIKAPIKQISDILHIIQPVVIITNKQHLDVIKSILPDSISICLLDEEYPFDGNQEDVLLKRLSQLIDTDPYCIINTSGSTGTPKGVVLNHRSFFDFTEWSIETLRINDHEIIGSLSPSIFDIYSHELCIMMSKGSTIVILPERLSAFPIKILEIMKKENVTYIFWVPTIMVNIANMDLLSMLDLPELKTVWFAGEVLPTKQYNYWHKHLPNTKFVNLYGPIEITLDCTYYIVDREFDDSEQLPIGFTCRNTNVLILNDNNQICKTNEEGELCVRGTSLAMGYYNNPEKTVAAFVQNPLNTSYPEMIYRTGDIVIENERGEIMFKGRRDTLVKHLGYRIELGEVEHVVVNTLKLVPNGCVVYHKQNKEIVLVYEEDTELSHADLRRQIGQCLPKYMVPTKFIKVDKMPMNANGKIDRLRLSREIENITEHIVDNEEIKQ
jgi:amino acid adenylation domain-containing protein